MKAQGVDLLLLTPGADLFYLTGFEHGHAGERLLAVVLKQDGRAQWIAPAMNVPQVEDRAMPGETVRGWTDTEWYTNALRDAAAGARTIAFDDDARAAFLLDLIAVAPKSRLVRASEVMRSLRIRKDASELAMLRAVARRVDDTIDHAIHLCQPGRTEAQIDHELRVTRCSLKTPKQHRVHHRRFRPKLGGFPTMRPPNAGSSAARSSFSISARAGLSPSSGKKPGPR